jgi:hypothetical protein
MSRKVLGEMAESVLQSRAPNPMMSLWTIAAGVAALAALVAARALRRSSSSADPETLQPVSEEWLSNARARKEENW